MKLATSVCCQWRNSPAGKALLFLSHQIPLKLQYLHHRGPSVCLGPPPRGSHWASPQQTFPEMKSWPGPSWGSEVVSWRQKQRGAFSREPQVRAKLNPKNSQPPSPQALQEWTTMLLLEFGCLGSERLAVFVDSDITSWLETMLRRCGQLKYMSVNRNVSNLHVHMLLEPIGQVILKRRICSETFYQDKLQLKNPLRQKRHTNNICERLWMLAESNQETRKPGKEPWKEPGMEPGKEPGKESWKEPDKELCSNHLTLKCEDQLHIQNFCSLFRVILVSSATTVDMAGI